MVLNSDYGGGEGQLYEVNNGFYLARANSRTEAFFGYWLQSGAR